MKSCADEFCNVVTRVVIGVHLLRLFLALGILAAVEADAQQIPDGSGDAQPAVQQQEQAPPRTGRSRFFDPEDRQLDLSYFLENPRGFLPIPIVVTEPAVGYGGGAAGMFLRPRTEAGSEGFARPNISAVGAFGTQNG